MAEVKTERKKPVPQKYESILAGVLKLSLSERVEIAKQVHDSIKNEVADLKQKASEAEKIAGNGAV